MTVHTTQMSLPYKKQLNWPPLSVRRLQSRLVLFYEICHQNIAIPIPLFTNTAQNYTPHLKHKRKQLGYRQLSTSTVTCYTNTATPPEQSQTGIHCHPVCVRLQRCSLSRKV